ncbi:ArsR family transcriptional regulator [Thermonema lapsum]|uniref:ArsR family transcriptional regulator n=1 Tax=Thermonema lapsum TaxID=28195 RepID=A0A846MRG6_9BACT|nr:metalloregulator ArsR/SmtB family transcription factor [Thermonema lapsum]NIK73962.1 ArsR family transcriptional regulator [Thermonema lapsum]
MTTEELNLEALTADKIEKVAFILKAIAHPMRLGIVKLLAEHEELSVSAICEMLGSEQSLTSHHLSNMKLKGILDCKRDGKNILYSLKMKEVLGVLKCMSSCDAF